MGKFFIDMQNLFIWSIIIIGGVSVIALLIGVIRNLFKMNKK